LAGVLEEKKLVKFAGKAKVELLWLEMQFKDIIFNQTTKQPLEERE
jgi:hypothetical protein